MKLIFGAAFGLISTSWVLSQQVGVVNLPLPKSTEPVEEQKIEPPPPGCTRTTGGMADGAVTPPDNQPRTISLEIINLNSQTLEAGRENRAEVRLKNVGDMPITIPWSTDPGVSEKAPNPDTLQWGQGNLDIVLVDNKKKTIPLKTPEWPLYGSNFVDGSQLTIRPGEWATAFVDFKVEDLYEIVPTMELPKGEVRLFSKWGQASRTWNRQKCGWYRAWFDYDLGDYYKQERPAITVQVNVPGSRPHENTK